MADDYIKRSDAINAYKNSLAKDNHRTNEGSLVHVQEHNHILHILDKLTAAAVISLADHERMKRELNIEIQALRNAANGYKKQLAQVTAERDQAVADLRKAAQCDTCRFNGDVFCHAEACRDGDMWQWRGVPESEKNALDFALIRTESLQGELISCANNKSFDSATNAVILNDFMKGVE